VLQAAALSGELNVDPGLGSRGKANSTLAPGRILVDVPLWLPIIAVPQSLVGGRPLRDSDVLCWMDRITIIYSPRQVVR